MSAVGVKGEKIDLRSLRHCLARESYRLTYHRFAEGESKSRGLGIGALTVILGVYNRTIIERDPGMQGLDHGEINLIVPFRSTPPIDYRDMRLEGDFEHR